MRLQPAAMSGVAGDVARYIEEHAHRHHGKELMLLRE